MQCNFKGQWHATCSGVSRETHKMQRDNVWESARERTSVKALHLLSLRSLWSNFMLSLYFAFAEYSQIELCTRFLLLLLLFIHTQEIRKLFSYCCCCHFFSLLWIAFYAAFATNEADW